METHIDINGDHSQVNPAATQAVQNYYYGTPVPLREETAAHTVVVLGAGVDAAVGFSTPCSLVPKITEWLETEEGQAVDTVLRKRLKGLRFSYTKFVDDAIERLAQHFYGFFANKQSEIKTYLYIAWTLWAYLVHEEQMVEALFESGTPLPIYNQLHNKKQLQVITFNHTTWAATVSPSAIYFNGNLTDYVDIENKNNLQVDGIHTLNLVRFFQNRLADELSLESEHIALPIPSFMPPLKLKPVITGQYVTTWYHTAEALAQAERILLLGHSLRGGDAFFNDMLRANRRANLIVIDRDLEAACRDVCLTFQQPANRYTPFTVQGHPARKYDNRLTVVGADLKEIDLSEWLE